MSEPKRHLRTVPYFASLIQVDPFEIERGLESIGAEPALQLNDVLYYASEQILNAVDAAGIIPPAERRGASPDS